MMLKKNVAMWGVVFLMVVTAKAAPVDGVKDGKEAEGETASVSEGGNTVAVKEQKVVREDEKLKTQALEIANESYKESVENLKWAIGGIIAIIGVLVTAILAAVGFVIVKHSKEYKEALDEAREAAKEARDASYRTGDLERLAQKKVDNIDDKVNKKLEEIEIKGKDLIGQLNKKADEQRKLSDKQAEERRKIIDEEGEKQRRILALWGKEAKAYREKNYELCAKCDEEIFVLDPGNYNALNNGGIALTDLARMKEGGEADNLFAQACEKFEKSLAIKPNFHMALHNWGVTLADLAKMKGGEKADELFAQACKKYEEALVIKPDYYEALNNWGTALIGLAKRKKGKGRDGLLDKAKEKLLEAEKIKKGAGAYNLACICALRDDGPKCRKWLELGQEEGALTSRKHAMEDKDLEGMRDKEWFKGIRWKGE